MPGAELGTDQNGLQLIFGAFRLVHEHLLCDVFPIFHAIQFVIGVTVQHGPTQELRQGLRWKRKTTKPVMREEKSSRLQPGWLLGTSTRSSETSTVH